MLLPTYFIGYMGSLFATHATILLIILANATYGVHHVVTFVAILCGYLPYLNEYK